MQAVLNFWFDELSSSDWFNQSDAVDEKIRRKFAGLHEEIVAGEKAHWRDEPRGRLAEIIVLDQFSRNMFRNTANAFSSDPLALALAQEAVRCGADQQIDKPQLPFLYMPYMHSESALVHKTAVKLFSTTSNLAYEERHKAIIDRFGRYPHRNKVLGRTSTPDEVEWMKTHSGF